MSGETQEIVYALVARKSEEGGVAKVMVLSEYTTTTGNFQTLARRICEKVPIQDTKLSFGAETHVFDILIDQGIIYMCMVPMTEKQTKRLPFAFLADIKACFCRLYQSRLKSVTASECYESFAATLRQRMDYYQKNPNLDKVDKIRKDVAEVKEIMVQNVDELLKRGEKLKILVGKTDDLAKEAVTFKHRTTELKDRMWWRNFKMMLIIACPIIIGGFWAMFWLCGGIDFCNCQTCAAKPATPAPKPIMPAPKPPAPTTAPPHKMEDLELSLKHNSGEKSGSEDEDSAFANENLNEDVDDDIENVLGSNNVMESAVEIKQQQSIAVQKKTP